MSTSEIVNLLAQMAWKFAAPRGPTVDEMDDFKATIRAVLAPVVTEPVQLTPIIVQDTKDAERLDWMSHQGLDGLNFALVVDAPHDGKYRVDSFDGIYYGTTFRDAIDAAILDSKEGNS